MSRPARLAALALLLPLAAACAPTGPAFDAWGNPVMHQGPNIGTNTVLGTAGGAVAGGLIGRSLGGRDGRGTRTTLGAIGGAAIGGILGNQFEPPRQAFPQQGWGQQPQGFQGWNVPQPGWGVPQQGWGNQGWGQPGLGQGYTPNRGGW